MMRLSIHQPNLFPRLKVLQKIALAGHWVILDDVQYMPREWQNRSRIRYLSSSDNEFWVTLPARRPNGRNSRISEIRIIDLNLTIKRIFKSLERCYQRSEFWPWIAHYCELLIQDSTEKLSEVCVTSALQCYRLLEIPVQITYSSTLNVTGARSERLANICTEMGAKVYLSGSGSRAYMDQYVFARRGIRVGWQDWSTPSIANATLDWRHISFLDYLARYGPDHLRYHLLHEGSILK
jgi:hypothetical protein